MGLRSSPHVAVKGTHTAKEIVFGDRHCPSNPFRWHSIRLNLPVMPTYTPSLPWVSKLRADGTLAAGVPRFVDDLGPVGQSEEDCWQVAHAVASRYSDLGLQIASRKTCLPSQCPGAWAGTHVFVLKEGIGVTCGPDKWTKAKGYLSAIRQELVKDGLLNHKILEQQRGFFIHLQCTYPCITPFLKGMHLTLDSWRPHRDSEGWKQPDSEDTEDFDDSLFPSDPSSAPVFVTAPQLYEDLDCLDRLFQPKHPPIRFIRSNKIVLVSYGFGDASGDGFGRTFLLGDGTTQFCHGTWGSDSESMSSNYRELLKLVMALEHGCDSGFLLQSEVFIFTDNSSAEGCFYKGNSPSRTLCSLILHLRVLEMLGQVRLHMTHVSGTRMIRQGTDGLSRGNYSSGFMAGESTLSFIPLHLDVLGRSPALLPWLQSWIPTDKPIQPLTPEDWFSRGHGTLGGQYNADRQWHPSPSDENSFLWVPAPAATGAAVEELALSRLKCPHDLHIFLCPWLFTHHWRKQLFKVTDLVLELTPGPRSEWPADMHEPLLLGLTLPLLPSPPWSLRNTNRVLELGREVRRM